jgi:hypothetical protein
MADTVSAPSANTDELYKIVENAEKKQREDDEEAAFQLMLLLSAEEVKEVDARHYISENDEELALKMQLEESRALALYSQIRSITISNPHPTTTLEKGGSLTLYQETQNKKTEKEKAGWSPASAYYPTTTPTINTNPTTNTKPLSADAPVFVPKTQKEDDKEKVGCIEGLKTVVASVMSTPVLTPRSDAASDTSSIIGDTTPLLKEKTE